MSSPFRQLGRVLAESQNETRTRPSFRPPPNLAHKFVAPKGRFAALRRFGALQFKGGRNHAS
jgi:hypothetical protein